MHQLVAGSHGSWAGWEKCRGSRCRGSQCGWEIVCNKEVKLCANSVCVCVCVCMYGEGERQKTKGAGF